MSIYENISSISDKCSINKNSDQDQIINLVLCCLYAIVGLIIILSNIVSLIVYLIFKEKNVWKLTDIDIIIIYIYDILGGIYGCLTSVSYCNDVHFLNIEIGCLVEYCLLVFTILELSKMNLLKSIEKLVSFKFKAKMKKFKSKYRRLVVILKISSRLFSSIFFFIFSYSAIFFNWNSYKKNKKCTFNEIFDTAYVLIGTIFIFIIICSTIIIHLITYIFIRQQNNRKIGNIERRRSFKPNDLDLNKKLKKNLTRLNLQKSQTVFCFAFSILIIPSLVIIIYQVFDVEEHDKVIKIFLDFFLGLSLNIFSIEPFMYFWSLMNLRKFFK
jgi:hypothetical protein